MSQTPEEIDQLLRQAQAAEPVVAEFADVWLQAFRKDLLAVVEWQRREGRDLVIAGAAPEQVRAEVEQRLQQARTLLRDRLARLVGWARESGRLRD